MHSLKGIQILIVEDDEMLRDILCDIFTSQDAEVIQAENGQDALTILKQKKIDAVITDMCMHGGDGVTLAGNIKDLPNPPGVFICTGFNDLSQEMAKDLNVIKVFEKPFDKNDLIDGVYQYISSRNQ